LLNISQSKKRSHLLFSTINPFHRASTGATLKLHFSQWQTNEILWSSKDLMLSDFPFAKHQFHP